MNMNQGIIEAIYQPVEEISAKLGRLEKDSIKQEKPFLTIDEASKYLGISKNTIYQYTFKGKIPYHKLHGRRLYFNKNDIDNFILNKNNRYKSNDEIESKAFTRVVLDRMK
jgi:excisionase family DNA binding protein